MADTTRLDNEPIPVPEPTRGDDALALWAEWFATAGDPYVAQGDLDDRICFFCSQWPG